MNPPPPTAVSAPAAGSKFLYPALILFAALFAIVPLLVRGPSCGDDFNFHLSSWIDAQHSWRQGIPYPHWAVGPNFGAGEPRFVFYPPLTWMLGAALGLLLPWHFVPIALTFLILAAIGFASRALARELLPDPAATLAGCAAIFFGYALYTAYQRTAYGELAGGFWIPLILLFALRDRNPGAKPLGRALDGSALPLAFLITGAWLSNAPVGVMACYLLAAAALASALLGKSWSPILRAAVATPLGLALSALYLLPGAVEQPWVDIQQATLTPGHQIEDNWLFHHNPDPAWWWPDHELQYASITATAMITLALISTFVAYRRGILAKASKPYWLPLALVAPGVLFFLLPISQPVWNILPKLRFLQFPWRWMVVLEAPLGLFFAAAVWSLKPNLRKLAFAGSMVFFLLAIYAANRSFFLACVSTQSVVKVVDSYATGAGFSGTPEYLPPGATSKLIPADLPGACLVSNPDLPLTDGSVATACLQTFPTAPLQGRHGAEFYEINAVTSQPGYLILRLRSFPTWKLTLNGQPVTPAVTRKDGLLSFAVPQGRINFTATWTATRDVLAARAISTIALLLLIVLAFVERRANPVSAVRLSS